MTYHDDEHLLQALQQRSERATTVLYERGYRYSIPRLLVIGNSLPAAEDAFQDGMIAFLKNIMKIVVFVGLLVQLHTYVRNKAVDAFRKQKRERKKLKRFFNEQLPDDDLDAVMQEQLREAMTKLSPESQELLRLLIVEEMKSGEAAKLLGIEKDSVYNQKSRCIKYLVKLIKNQQLA